MSEVESRRDVVARFLEPPRIISRPEVLASPSPVPDTGGVYGWWFRTLPRSFDVSGCVRHGDLTLLYVGISPQPPSGTGRPPSSQTLRKRIRTHYAGNAEASTLRRSLGCLLADELGIELRRVGSGGRTTFLEGERELSSWMGENAFVSWVACERPWEVEDHLIETLDLPLNLDGNARHPFRRDLSALRSAAMRSAERLPIVENPGVGGRIGERDAILAGRFAAVLRGERSGTAKHRLARLVLAGEAAGASRESVAGSRSMLAAALSELRRSGVSVGVLVTPAGFIDHKVPGRWDGSVGWTSSQGDFDRLATVAASVARDLLTPAIRDLALGVVDHLIVGIDVWPTAEREPHAEVACLWDVAADTVRPVTGKSYPTTGQQDLLIRDPEVGSHVVAVGDERVAVLVCFDLGAWSPRGNAVAKGVRRDAWRGMQAAVAAGHPTLAVQLPHTVDNARTWTAAWAALGRTAGGDLIAGTTAVRHLDRDYRGLDGLPDDRLLSGTAWGARALDAIVAGRKELGTARRAAVVAERTRAAKAPRAARTARAVSERRSSVSPSRGVGLAQVAAEVFRRRAAAYPDGVRIGELAEELSRAGHLVAGDHPYSTLQSALNGAQARGWWARQGGGLWRLGDGHSKMESGLSGRPLAEALRAYVEVTYPGRVFHYEEARIGLERSGVPVRGTGQTSRSALLGGVDLFERVPGRRGFWRWK